MYNEISISDIVNLYLLQPITQTQNIGMNSMYLTEHTTRLILFNIFCLFAELELIYSEQLLRFF